ncbi:MAG TPA: hypothetical protein VK457_14990, partial [Chloroflexota bacterium]|nr:hypothetical protein [Chloroflexota bacterium]
MVVPVLAAVAGLSLLVLYLTFVPDLPTNPGYTLRHWGVIARPYVLTTVLPNTAIVGAGTTLIAVLFGVPLA